MPTTETVISPAGNRDKLNVSGLLEGLLENYLDKDLICPDEGDFSHDHLVRTSRRTRPGFEFVVHPGKSATVCGTVS